MKIAIVGAGVNGLYLARKLAERGNDVTVFEKKNKIGKEACSGLFSERIFNFIPESRRLIKNEINYVLIHFPKKTVKVNFARKFFVMSHAELDRLAAESAQKAGAKILLNQELTPPDPVNFDRVVGCDGANSAVRKYLGLPEPNFRLGILGFVPQKNQFDFVETWPVKKGFIWKIPRGEETEYGVMAGLDSARKFLNDFCFKNNIRLQNIKSALIPQGLLIPKNEKITLCGDSAGLTKPWSGGGVIWGLGAADLLLKNFPDFVRYQKAAKKIFLPEIVLSKIAIKAVYFLGFKLSWLLPSKITIDGDFIL